MANLTEFIGEIVNSISKARFYADQSSVALSEQYFADPFTKNLPVPHYTIDDVEVKVPVMVIGIKSDSLCYEDCKDELIEASKTQLPLLLLRNLRNSYIKQKEDSKKSDTSNLYDSDTANELLSTAKLQNSSVIPKSIQNFFISLSKSVSTQLVEYLKEYLSTYNYLVLKLLDLTEALSNEAYRQLMNNLPHYPLDAKPDDELAYSNRNAKSIGSAMFFEYKKILQSNSCVEIDPNTAKMNEFSSQPDHLMHITIKVREQDLNLLVEKQEDKEKRFLSLT